MKRYAHWTLNYRIQLRDIDSACTPDRASESNKNHNQTEKGQTPNNSQCTTSSCIMKRTNEHKQQTKKWASYKIKWKRIPLKRHTTHRYAPKRSTDRPTVRPATLEFRYLCMRCANQERGIEWEYTEYCTRYYKTDNSVSKPDLSPTI